MGTAWLLVLGGVLFCASLVRSAAQAAHYTVWRTDTQLGSRGGLVRRYEMRLAARHLSYADLRRSPATWALHYCPVFVTARPLPAGGAVAGLAGGRAVFAGAAARLCPAAGRPGGHHDRSMLFFLPAGIPCGLCLLLTAVSRYTLPALTVPLLVLTGCVCRPAGRMRVGYRREGVWQQNGRSCSARQHGFHLHNICVLLPDPALTALQSPWAAAVHRTNLTLIFPGGIEGKVRSVRCEDISFVDL